MQFNELSICGVALLDLSIHITTLIKNVLSKLKKNNTYIFTIFYASDFFFLDFGLRSITSGESNFVWNNLNSQNFINIFMLIHHIFVG